MSDDTFASPQDQEFCQIFPEFDKNGDGRITEEGI